MLELSQILALAIFVIMFVAIVIGKVHRFIPAIVGAELLVNGAKVSEDGQRVAFRALYIVDKKAPKGSYLAPDLHRQSAILAHSEQGWRVVQFEDSLEKCCF